jgi:hypothetical protein
MIQLNFFEMTTFIVQADNKISKALIAIFNALNVSFEVKKEREKEEKSPYNSEFVKMVLERAESAKNGNTTRINPKDLWGSLGLK